MKTITVRAEDELVEAAEKRAESEHTTLHERIHEWVAEYATGIRPTILDAMTAEERRRYAEKAMQFLEELRTRVNTGGRKFTRDELNER